MPVDLTSAAPMQKTRVELHQFSQLKIEAAALFAAEEESAAAVSENDLSDGDADDAFSQEVTEEEARAMVADAVSMAQSPLWHGLL